MPSAAISPQFCYSTSMPDTSPIRLLFMPAKTPDHTRRIASGGGTRFNSPSKQACVTALISEQLASQLKNDFMLFQNEGELPYCVGMRFCLQSVKARKSGEVG